MSTQTTTPDFSSQDTDPNNDELQEIVFTKRGCCFWLPCFGSSRSDAVWERIPTSERGEERPWWGKGLDALMKVREWSELVAGPKWKTFIRRFNKNRSKAAKFQYDPLSYALNFDEGQNSQFADDDRIFRDFSSRYASLPGSSKSSMDLGKDSPSFT